MLDESNTQSTALKLKRNISTDMSMSVSVLLLLLHISESTCNNIKTKQLNPAAYDSNMNIMINEISRIVTAIERQQHGKVSFISIIQPTDENNTVMPQIMEKITQKLSAKWLVTTNDGVCCDSHEPRIMVPTKPIRVEYKPHLYIIPLRKHNGLNYLHAQLNLMSEENSFNPGAIFLLITLTHQCGDYKDNNNVNPYFDQMWRKNCMSSVILALSECDFKIAIITATPFSDDNVCRQVQENGTKHLYSKWHEEEIDLRIYKSYQKNFNKCTFFVGTIPNPPYIVGKPFTNANKTLYEIVGGIDLELLEIVSTVYNITYVFDVHHGFDTGAMAKFLPNGSIVGIFVDVLHANLDISVGGIIPYDYNYHRYHYSGYYKFSSFGWAVNDASPAPQWKILFGAFSQEVWLISCFVFLITSSIYTFLDRFVKTYSTGNCYNCIEFCNFQAIPIIQYFSITLGLSSILRPKSPCLRVLYFAWSIYSLHMTIAYLSMLFLLISNPPLEKEIKTVQDLKDSGLKVGLQLIVFQRFANTDLDRVTRDVMDDSFICLSWETCIEDLKQQRNFSLLIAQDVLDFYIDAKQSRVHTVSEVFFSYGASVLTSKGNPLSPGIDKLVYSVTQAGLVDKWDRDTRSKFASVNTKDKLSGSRETAAILTLSQLEGAFFVLVVGLVISSLLLLGELVISFLKLNVCC